MESVDQVMVIMIVVITFIVVLVSLYKSLNKKSDDKDNARHEDMFRDLRCEDKVYTLFKYED